MLSASVPALSAEKSAQILRLPIDRDSAVFNLNEIGLRRFAFPLQTPKFQRTRYKTAFSSKTAVSTPKIIDAPPQKVKDGGAPNYQYYMQKRLAQGLCFQFFWRTMCSRLPMAAHRRLIFLPSEHFSSQLGH